MSEALSYYFADLLACNGVTKSISSSDQCSSFSSSSSPLKPQHILMPEIIFDNARLPSPLLGQLTDEDDRTLEPTMGCSSNSEHCGSYHTRSTISTAASTHSSSSHPSVCSNASNGSTASASCRWDSNPSSSKGDRPVKLDASVQRPRCPARHASSDNVKVQIMESPESPDSNSRDKEKRDKILSRPKRNSSHRDNSSSSDSDNTNRSRSPFSSSPKKTNRKQDKPSRPIRRTSSSNNRENNNSSSKLTQRLPQRQISLSPCEKSCFKSVVGVVGNSNSAENTIIPKKTDNTMDGSSSSSSERSLKGIICTKARQKRAAATSAAAGEGGGGSGVSGTAFGTTTTNSFLVGPRTSPPRTVNEILGQSMEELQMTW